MSVDETFKERLIAKYGAVNGDKLAKIIQDCMDAGGKARKIENCIKNKIKADPSLAGVNIKEVGAKTMAHFVAFG